MFSHMIRIFLLLFNIVFILNCFAGKHEKESSFVEKTICSPTECYTVLAELGEGAFGKVYAVENSQGERFALKSYKSLKKNPLADNILANAEREYERGLQLNHSNIVKVFDLFKEHSQENHGMYLVLELIEGQTFYGIPKRSLLIDQSLNSALQMVVALHYAFSQNLIYLDLHPHNIMMTESSDTMIIDLASFFSLDELFDFAKKEDENHEETPENAQKAVSAKHDGKARHKKLHHFFQKHPKLLGKIKGKIKKKGNKKGQHKIKKEGKKFAAPNQDQPEQAEIDFQALSPLLTSYFDNITEICGFLITKSNLSREEKFKLRFTLKKLAWNYTEDIEDGLDVTIDDYFNQLIDTLKS